MTELARPAVRDANDTAKRRYLESTGRRRFVRFWREFVRRRPLGTAGAVLIILMLLTAAFADRIAPYDPVEIRFSDLLQGPSFQHLLGTDPFGRDVFSRIVYGSRTALLVGFSASFVGCTLGLVLGVVGAYFGLFLAAEFALGGIPSWSVRFLFAALATAAATLMEGPKIPQVDDDLLMQVVPMAVLALASAVLTEAASV